MREILHGVRGGGDEIGKFPLPAPLFSTFYVLILESRYFDLVTIHSWSSYNIVFQDEREARYDLDDL